MVPVHQPLPTQAVLVVSCGSALSEAAKRAARPHAFAPSVEDAVNRLSDTTIDCVIACIDPIKNESMAQLGDLCTAVKPYNIPIVTISQFNPSWIENLVVQFGAFAHFKRFPDKAQISAITEVHARVPVPHRKVQEND